MPRPSSREAILDAAEQIAIEAGAGNLTLEAVAARAGVSKGGLLYNFKSKDALLIAMVQRLMSEFDNNLVNARERLGGEPNANLRAHLEAAMNKTERVDRISSALLAVLANYPDLLSSVREHHRAMWEKAGAAGKEYSTDAAILCLATCGLNFLHLMGLTPFTPKQRKEICEVISRKAISIEETATSGT